MSSTDSQIGTLTKVIAALAVISFLTALVTSIFDPWESPYSGPHTLQQDKYRDDDGGTPEWWDVFELTHERLEDMRNGAAPPTDDDVEWLADGIRNPDTSWPQREHMLAWLSDIGLRLDRSRFEPLADALLWVLICDDCPQARALAARVTRDLGLARTSGFAQGLALYDRNPWGGEQTCDEMTPPAPPEVPPSTVNSSTDPP